MTSRTSLTVQQGTTYAVAWPIEDSSGAPVDLTGWSARSQVRLHVGDEEVLHEWSTDIGNITLTESKVTLHLASGESSAWDWDVAKYDVELTDPQGRVARIAEGSIFVSPEVTRA